MSTPTSPGGDPERDPGVDQDSTSDSPTDAETTFDEEAFSIGDAVGPEVTDTFRQDTDGDGVDYKVGLPDTIDPEEFFTTETGETTLATQEDLERILPNSDKPHLEEITRYWVNKPYAYAVIFKNRRLNEDWYIPVEPQLTEPLQELRSYIAPKLRSEINFGNIDPNLNPHGRAKIIQTETVKLLKRYQLVDRKTLSEEETLSERIQDVISSFLEARKDQAAEADERVEPIPVDRDENGKLKKLDQRQLRKLLYYLVRDIIRYSRIDPLKHDVNIEDIHCVGYGQPIFVNHSKFGLVVTTIQFPDQELDSFVNNLAEDAGKGISKRNPDVDATLSDGSRAQLTLKGEISGHGTNFTIRQFREVPFTPIDLINWETYSIDQMVYLWLAIEHKKSMIIAGGTASGKTTSLNALTLFMPANSKFVSIEDTRELELPQRAWLSSKTRPGFNDDDAAEIDEFDLLENGLRQRPDYVIMGEVRGEEGRTLFQVMSTGHCTYTTFHADDFQKLINRFTGDPINVPKAMFSSLDLIAIQKMVHLDGERLRRNTEIVELDSWNASEEKWDGGTRFEWDPQTDDHVQKDESTLLDEIRMENGWNNRELHRELWSRRIVLSYLVKEGLNTYPAVAATLQAFMRQPEDVLTLIAEDRLKEHLDNLSSGGLIDIDIDESTEALVPRPTPSKEVVAEVSEILEETDDYLEAYQGRATSFSDEPIRTATGSPMTNEQLDPDDDDQEPVDRPALDDAPAQEGDTDREPRRAATKTPTRRPGTEPPQENGSTPSAEATAASGEPTESSTDPSERDEPSDTETPVSELTGRIVEEAEPDKQDKASPSEDPSPEPTPESTTVDDTQAAAASDNTDREDSPDATDSVEPTPDDTDTSDDTDTTDTPDHPPHYGEDGVPGRGIRTDRVSGIGNAYKSRLEDIGVEDIEDLANIKVESVADRIDVPVKTVSGWVAAANTWEGVDE